ncbi:cytochrome b/b6 domain-containing protein [Desulfolutivibrio sulfodismutans]|nr:cytochrome b/b6 domain-containing protein [Desulfolutivibrio sulfodismutans]
MSDTTKRPMRTIYLYTRYERFWHWFQALLILLLLVTGFEVHGSITLFGFEQAVTVHNFLGLTWLVAFAFFVFWVFTTGEWKQYVPTSKKMVEVMIYYGYGIFSGQPHPCPKRHDAKHNPLQRMTYLSLAAVLLPFQMVTGLLYYLYNSWTDMGITGLSLGVVAVAHLIGAFAILIFLIVHVYMTTTGHTIFAHVKAMFTGREEVEDVGDVAEWEKKNPA